MIHRYHFLRHFVEVTQRITLRARGITPSVTVAWDGDAALVANDGEAGLEAALWATGLPGYDPAPFPAENDVADADFTEARLHPRPMPPMPLRDVY